MVGRAKAVDGFGADVIYYCPAEHLLSVHVKILFW